MPNLLLILFAVAVCVHDQLPFAASAFTHAAASTVTTSPGPARPLVSFLESDASAFAVACLALGTTLHHPPGASSSQNDVAAALVEMYATATDGDGVDITSQHQQHAQGRTDSHSQGVYRHRFRSRPGFQLPATPPPPIVVDKRVELNIRDLAGQLDEPEDVDEQGPMYPNGVLKQLAPPPDGGPGTCCSGQLCPYTGGVCCPGSTHCCPGGSKCVDAGGAIPSCEAGEMAPIMRVTRLVVAHDTSVEKEQERKQKDESRRKQEQLRKRTRDGHTPTGHTHSPDERPAVPLKNITLPPPLPDPFPRIVPDAPPPDSTSVPVCASHCLTSVADDTRLTLMCALCDVCSSLSDTAR